jgi:hypothetical protein
VVYTPLENVGSYDGFGPRHEPVFRIVDGTMEITQRFDGEQEHSFLVQSGDGKELRFRVFSVEADLYSRRPFKGDMHIHSDRSDGKESPGYVAASCRRIGLDFMAVTDHGLYTPSLEARSAFAGADVGLRIYPGEEVHPPENPVHIINFGGSSSVNERFAGESYSREVAAIEERLADIADERCKRWYASSEWCFRSIRDAGGLGIFCHPYWLTSEHYHIPGSLTDLLFERRPFDAYELIGGYHLDEVESNILQVRRYEEELAKNGDCPVVGVSDAHGCDSGALFGWYYTVVFSPSVDLSDLIGSIRDGYSVAVEHLPGTSPRAHGRFRLVKYAQFLMREVFPAHDAICATEGEGMLRYLSVGDRSVLEKADIAPTYLESCFTERVTGSRG